MATARTRCPHCHKHYDVPTTALGRTGRCSRCRKVFTLSAPGTPYPTEDDILQWLLEAGEEFERAEAETESTPETPVAEHAGDSPASMPTATIAA